MAVENEEVQTNEEQEDQGSQENSYLNMSDEEMMNVAPPTDVVVVEEQSTDVATDTKEESEEQKEAPKEEVKEEGESSSETAEAAATAEAVAGEAEKKPVEKSVEGTDTEHKEEKKPEPVVNYEAEYKRLLAPFKANGREIAVDSVDDAITLMQMGANYNKKMAALKPSMKLLKMLENNSLLDEEKLSFLIDLEKKNPAAIQKLVKDSGLDPLDLNTEDVSDYKPSTQRVDDKEIELDTVLDEIQESPSYARTLDVVSKQWDGASKKVIASTPQILKVINSHIESGIYDVISTAIEKERTFGRLSGLSDIEAYRQVGDQLQAQGAFDHLAPKSQGQQTAPPPVVVTPKPKMGNEDKLREKRRAASTPQVAAPSQAKAGEYNPLSLSDDEFSKLVQPRFL